MENFIEFLNRSKISEKELNLIHNASIICCQSESLNPQEKSKYTRIISYVQAYKAKADLLIEGIGPIQDRGVGLIATRY
jgi:hypothetical protein